MSKFGNLPGPGPGRPKGSRNKLSETFLRDFLGAWEKGGVEALERTMREEPATFVKVAASLLPSKVEAEIEYRAVVRLPSPAATNEEWLKEQEQEQETAH